MDIAIGKGVKAGPSSVGGIENECVVNQPGQGRASAAPKQLRDQVRLLSADAGLEL